MALLFVDEIAFSKHWREYATSVLKEWRESCVMVSPYCPCRCVMRYKTYTYSRRWGPLCSYFLLSGATPSLTNLSSIGATSALRPTNPAAAAFGTISVAFALYAVAAGALLLQRYADAEKFSASITVN